MPQRSPMFRHFRTENAEKTCKKMPVKPIGPIWRYFGPSMGVVASDGLLGPITKHLRGRKKNRKKGRKKMHTPTDRSLFPQHFIPLFGGASGGVFYVSSLSLHEADLSTKQLRKKGPAGRKNRLQVPKRKTSQILGKEICIAPEHLSC